MGLPDRGVSIALIVIVYLSFLVGGCYIAWRFRRQSKTEFIHSNRTQTAIPLALNFVASAMGSSVLMSYPEIGTIAGVQGVLTYAASSALPLLVFPVVAPLVRKKVPEGFILTMWVKERFGIIVSLYLTLLSLGTMFLYMVAELSSLQQIINTLTGLPGLPVVIVEVVVTTIYTALGGFRVSFITDNIQGSLIAILVVICACAIGTTVHIDTSLIDPSGLAKPTKLGYQLIWILLSGILFSDMFLSGFWMRAFASKTDKDLWIGCSLASIIVFVILSLVGSCGFIAAWAGVWTPDLYGGLSFFLLLETLPSWVVGFVVVMVMALSCAVFDSLQSAMVSTASNDFFRNRLPMPYVRGLVVLVIIPTIVLALRLPSILTIFLIANIFACATMPPILCGLSKHLYFLNGFDCMTGALGGMLSVWLFGYAYYGNAYEAAKLYILENGLYANDWSVFGVFCVAPGGSLVFMTVACSARISATWLWCKLMHRSFTLLDKPAWVCADAKEEGVMPIARAEEDVGGKQV